MILVSAKGLAKYYTVRKGRFFGERKLVRAVDGVDIEIRENENLGIVGESGCGKTTLGRIIAGLIKPDRGEISYLGRRLEEMERLELARFVQPIFQDPYSALNPVKTIREILSTPFRIHSIDYNDKTIVELLERVGLIPGSSFLDRYPHELSGGQRQRVVIARALSVNPKLIIADEPVSSLDSTIQAQILDLLNELHDKLGITIVVISHDINLVRAICKRTAVMYLGKIVEIGPTESVLNETIHPYTSALLGSYPSYDPDDKSWFMEPKISGDVPSAIDPPAGCRFRTRCKFAIESCSVNEPILERYKDEHFVACPVMLGGKGSPNLRIKKLS